MSCQPAGTSATDVITYVGIPLTVLGVIPILWNVARSFWIRRYLASLIPAKARKNVSLTVDPASGVVIVVIEKLELTNHGLLYCEPQPQTLAAREIEQVSTDLVGCSWMGLYAAGIATSKIGGTQRVIVDASLRFESLGIHCDKHTLLLLALGLGADPFRNQLQRGITEGSLVNAEGSPIITIRNTTGDSTVQLLSSLTFSKRRVLAWFYIMVVKHNRGLSYIPLALSRILRDFDATMLPGAADIKRNLDQLENDGISLELALSWTCYVEGVFYDEGNHELLPIPQAILGAREDALAELQNMNIDDLQAHLQIIFDADSDMATKVLETLRKAWVDMVPRIENGKRQGQPQRFLKDCQTCLHPTTLRRTSAILRDLHSVFRPDTAQTQHQSLMFDDPASPIMTAGRIWLGLSVIQLWRREEWETEIELHGRVAKPSSEGLGRNLYEDTERPRHRIYIG